mmetsp:Transcript_27747/g.50049  ORF Transcript_27747/g.50049 Transcript_27747/m.50049 type:complete len:279 (+) Transcript_27747:611-1447(+)
MRIFRCRLWINSPGGFANECKPLLSLSTSVGRHEVLLLAKQNLIGHILNIRCAMGCQGRITGKARESSIGLCRNIDGVPRQLTRLGIVNRSPRCAARGEPTSTVVQPVQILAYLTPDSISTHQNICVCLRSVLERYRHAASLAQILKLVDTRLDADGPLRKTMLNQNLLNHRPVHHDRRGQSGLQCRTDGVKPHEPIAGIVQSCQFVSLAISNLQPTNAVGGTRSGRHQFLVDFGIDLLQCPQCIRLNLNGTSVGCVGRCLFEQCHLHTLGVTCRSHD